MPSFLLQLNDNWRHKGHDTEGSLLSDLDEDTLGLIQTLKACSKIAVHLERGARLENLAQRVGYLLLEKKPALLNKRKQKIEEKTFDAFEGFGPISMLCSTNSKPKIQAALSQDSDEKEAPPLQQFDILPKMSLALQPIPEDDDSELEIEETSTSLPILFTNPFAPPSPHPEGEPHEFVPSKRSLIPPNESVEQKPHLEKEDEEESEKEEPGPEDLTGHVHMLSRVPVAMGGSSDVYCGEWRLPTTRKVAIKVLRTTQLGNVSAIQRRLRREMAIWWTLQHRNIVPLWGFTSEFGGLGAMISPWYKNGSATAYLKQYKCPWAERLKLLCDVASGLKYLHLHQPPIVHGDLKPTNILITDNGDACLCDFGLAVVSSGEGVPSGFTTSNFGGSIRYMAPELLASEDEDEAPKLTTFTDIYSLGCVGLELVTGQIPYAGRTLEAQVMHDIMKGILPARRPSYTFRSAFKDQSQFWGLLTSAWHPSSSSRPSIVNFVAELSNCRQHRGPMLSSGMVVKNSFSKSEVSLFSQAISSTSLVRSVSMTDEKNSNDDSPQSRRRTTFDQFILRLASSPASGHANKQQSTTRRVSTLS